MSAGQVMRDFEQGKLEIFFPTLTLIQMIGDNPKTHSGSGVIRQSPNNQLSVELFSSASLDFLEFFRKLLYRPAGRLIPESQFFKLIGTDTSGNEWTANHLLPEISGGPHGTRIHANLPMLTHESQSSATKEALLIKILSSVEFPCATGTVTTVSVGDTNISRSAIVNRIKFDFDGNSVEMTREPQNATLRFESQSTLPPAVEGRLIEALQFVLGESLQWNVLDKHTNGRRTVALRSQRHTSKGNILRPILESQDHFGERTWKLFQTYFKHIIEFDPNELHPISVWLRSIRRPNDGLVFTASLALGVAIEGLLTGLFPNLVTPSESHLGRCRSLIAHVSKWKNPLENEEEKSLMGRANGLLNQLTQVRAKDRLLELEARGHLRAKDIQAWTKLRNRNAHGVAPKDEELEGCIVEYEAVLTTLYQIIFSAIGYTGPFSDFATEGWPIAFYPHAARASLPALP